MLSFHYICIRIYIQSTWIQDRKKLSHTIKSLERVKYIICLTSTQFKVSKTNFKTLGHKLYSRQNVSHSLHYTCLISAHIVRHIPSNLSDSRFSAASWFFVIPEVKSPTESCAQMISPNSAHPKFWQWANRRKEQEATQVK